MKLHYVAGLAAGALAGLVALEVGFRLLPVNSGARMADATTAGATRTYVPNAPYVFSHGWNMINVQRAVTNAIGFPNSIAEPQPGGILIVGNSYIEALMLPYRDTVQGILEGMYPQRVAATGASENSLADGLVNIETYGARFKSSTVVLFVDAAAVSWLLSPPPPGHHGLQMDDKGEVRTTFTPYTESKLKPLLSQSALFRYGYYNLKLGAWIGKLGPSKPKPKVDPVAQNAKKAQLLAAAFERFVALGARQGFKPVVLVDADRSLLYRPAKTSPDAQDLALAESIARQQGATVISMEPVFRAHWERTGEHFDWQPFDGHWNQAAHRLAANEIRKVAVVTPAP